MIARNVVAAIGLGSAVALFCALCIVTLRLPWSPPEIFALSFTAGAITAAVRSARSKP